MVQPKDGLWVAVDLGPERQLAIDHYALRRWSVLPRSWVLEGAEEALDAAEWTTLRTHETDTKLEYKQAYIEGAWSVEGRGRACRCFRVRAIGSNPSAWYDHSLACGGMELYGSLVRPPADPAIEA